jgi:hypothetical protein
MKKSLKWLLIGFSLAVIGSLMLMSSNSVVFFIGIALGAVGILIILAISVNRTGI